MKPLRVIQNIKVIKLYHSVPKQKHEFADAKSFCSTEWACKVTY